VFPLQQQKSGALGGTVSSASHAKYHGYSQRSDYQNTLCQKAVKHHVGNGSQGDNCLANMIERLLVIVTTPIRKMSTEEIRHHLVDYQKINDCSKA